MGCGCPAGRGGAGGRSRGTARNGGQGGGCPHPRPPLAPQPAGASWSRHGLWQGWSSEARRGQGGGGAAAAAGKRRTPQPGPSCAVLVRSVPSRPALAARGSARHGRGKLTETLSGSPARAPRRALSPPPARGTSGLVVRTGRAASGRTRWTDYSSRQPPRRGPVPSRAALVCVRGAAGLEMREWPLRPGAAVPQVSAAGPGAPPPPLWAGTAVGSRCVGVWVCVCTGVGADAATAPGKGGGGLEKFLPRRRERRRARHGPCPGGAPAGPRGGKAPRRQLRPGCPGVGVTGRGHIISGDGAGGGGSRSGDLNLGGRDGRLPAPARTGLRDPRQAGRVPPVPPGIRGGELPSLPVGTALLGKNREWSRLERGSTSASRLASGRKGGSRARCWRSCPGDAWFGYSGNGRDSASGLVQAASWAAGEGGRGTPSLPLFLSAL